MDVQHACISKIVLEGEILPFIEARITGDFFPDPKHLKVFTYVTDHYKKYGDPPSDQALARAYPTYTLVDYPETTIYYLTQLQQDRKKVILTERVQEFVDILNDEEGADQGDALEAVLRQGLADAAHEVSQGRDTDFFLSVDRIMDRLTERRANPGYLRGITTGFDNIDRITGGLQDEQLITLIGTPKAGKSSVLLRMALTAKLHGYNVLFLTFEMSTEEQEDRLLSLLSGVALTKILNGTLTDVEMQAIERAMRIRQALSGFTISSDINSAMTLSGVHAKFQQYRPTVLFVDGVYLMDPEGPFDKGSPQALTELTRGFKRMAQSHRIPVVITTQALLSRSRSGLTMDSIGYSSSFAQDSDIIFGTMADDRVLNVSKLSVLAQRSGPKGDTYIATEWDHGCIEELDRTVYESRVAASAVSSGGAGGKPSSTQVLWGDDD